VIQKPGTDFTVSSSTLTFTTAPAANTSFFAVLLGSDNGGTVTPTDASVTPPKTTFFNTDPGNAADLGMLHIKSGDSGASVSSTSDELVIEGSSVGMSFLDATDGATRIAFGDSGDNDIGKIVYGHSSNQMEFVTNTATGLVIDGDGHVTMPKQPAFLAKPTNNQTNFNQGQTIVIVMDNEIFDNNGDFASNAFTAPVTGRYAFQYQVQINDISTQDSGTYYYIEINTSNRVFYELSSINAAIGSSSGQNYFCFTGSVTADMDASDTCNLRVVMAGTSGDGPSDISNNSHFSGHLVC